MSLSESDDGASAYEPVWVPDGEAAACTECQSQFTIFNRRHHCRLCGHIFCTQCSSSRVTAITGIQDSTHHRLWYSGVCSTAHHLVAETASMHCSRSSWWSRCRQPSTTAARAYSAASTSPRSAASLPASTLAGSSMLCWSTRRLAGGAKGYAGPQSRRRMPAPCSRSARPAQRTWGGWGGRRRSCM